MTNDSVVAKFIGIKRWKELRDSLNVEFYREISADKRITDNLFAFSLCLVGPVAAAAEVYSKSGTSLYSTLGFGISAVFAILFQRSIKRENSGLTSKKSLSLTHTAFALGCIPALLVVALDPSLLAKREQLLNSSSGGGAVQVSKLTYLFLISVFTLWVAVTEEYLFRGLLLSVIRRSKFISTPFYRTFYACIFSSLLFGLSHYALWGVGASLALTGLGLGLALGYVANGEKIWPMIIYHWGFDFLSTVVALMGVR